MKTFSNKEKNRVIKRKIELVFLNHILVVMDVVYFTKKRLYVPRTAVRKVLEWAYNLKSSGCFGFTRK